MLLRCVYQCEEGGILLCVELESLAACVAVACLDALQFFRSRGLARIHIRGISCEAKTMCLVRSWTVH